MRARALAAWAEHSRHGQVEVHIHPTLESTHPLYAFGVRTYNEIQRHAPWMHHAYFHYLEWAGMHRDARRILGADAFQRVVREHAPDVVVSVHAHTNHGFFELARAALPQHPPRCVTYCGELTGGYGFSRHWVGTEADLFIGATNECRDRAVRGGVHPRRSVQGGFLLRPRFYQAPPRDEARRRLAAQCRLDPGRFILVLGTGEAAANNHLAFLRALQESGLALQVIALCGHNAHLLADLRATGFGDRLTVRPLRHTAEMELILGGCDLLVARPGTGMTSEAILMGCPVFFNTLGSPMPQECITLAYARAHGFGRILRRSSDLPHRLAGWVSEPSRMEAERAATAAARPGGHPEHILRLILGEEDP